MANRIGKPSYKSLETWGLLLAGVLESMVAVGIFPADSVGAHVVAGLAALFATLRTGLKASESRSQAVVELANLRKKSETD